MEKSEFFPIKYRIQRAADIYKKNRTDIENVDEPPSKLFSTKVSIFYSHSLLNLVLSFNLCMNPL